MSSKLLLTVFLSIYTVFHPFHVSVMDIEHNEKAQSLQISQRIFIDDLENGLKGFHKLEWVDTYNPKDPAKLDSLIHEYLKEKVFININGESKSFEYLGSEVEGDARWCYYEIPGLDSINSAEITNVVLMEKFDDQQNIVHFKAKGKLKSYKLDKGTKFKNFEF